ncbi:hypothetical protein EU528_12295 [Candidatus Thorarchaeota archaeon]|nr:MAG: hypothetical protein EU528_12295 [Candidatus Thorarchaeota archaeon]
MGFDKNRVDYSGRYPRMYVSNYLPLLGSIIVTVLLTYSYTLYLFDQAILLDTMLPIVEANRIDNILIWMFSSTALCVLTYIVLIPVSQSFHDLHTASSDILELFENAKSKMGIDFEVNLKVNKERGIMLTCFRTPFNASVVISSRAQKLLLGEKELGEAIIAHELVFLKSSRPWWMVAAAVAFSSVIAGFLLPTPSAIDFPGLFEYTIANIIRTVPIIVMFLVMFLCDSASRNKIDSTLEVEKEYQVSPILARMALLEGIAIKRTDIEIRTDVESVIEVITDDDNNE